MKSSKTICTVLAAALIVVTVVPSQALAQYQVCDRNGENCYTVQATAPVATTKTYRRAGLFGFRRVEVQTAAPVQATYRTVTRASQVQPRYTYGPSNYVASNNSQGGTGYTTVQPSCPAYTTVQASQGYGSQGGTGYNQVVSSRVVETKAQASPSTYVCECDCECPECGHTFRCNCTDSGNFGTKETPDILKKKASAAQADRMRYVVNKLQEDPEWQPRDTASPELKELVASLKAWRSKAVDEAVQKALVIHSPQQEDEEDTSDTSGDSLASSQAVVPSSVLSKGRAVVPPHIAASKHGVALENVSGLLAASF